VVSTCSKIAHGDCECSHYCRVVEKGSLVEEGEMSKVVGIGPGDVGLLGICGTDPDPNA
jgi:hypothetical protein